MRFAAAACLAAEASEFCDQSAMREGKSRLTCVYYFFIRATDGNFFEQVLLSKKQIIQHKLFLSYDDRRIKTYRTEATKRKCFFFKRI